MNFNTNDKEYLYQTETVRYAAGTQAMTLQKEITFDSSYTKCVGLAVLESKTGGIPMYRIGIQDNNKTYFSPVHKDLLRSHPTAGMRVEDRFLQTNIKADGHKVKIITETPVQLTEDLEFDIVFLLERNTQK